MMKIVLDTNVLVSALLRPQSLPARILDFTLTRQLTLVIDHRIFAEYQDVLYRPEFAFSPHHTGELLEFLWKNSERIYAIPLAVQLPDPADAMFIEVAVSALADALITGN